MLFPTIMFCQSTIGLPDIVNYNKTNYNGGLQNWDINQDQNNLLYFANNEGLLSFDGTYWNLYPLPNKTIVRSLEITKDNKVYVGGQDEIGYFSSNTFGKLVYTSLLSLIPEKERTFGDIWDIYNFNNDLFFRTSSKIFKLTNSQIFTYPCYSEWLFMGICNDKIFAQDLQKGLLFFENGQWMPLSSDLQIPKNSTITSILSNKNKTIVTTLKNGIFILSDKNFIPFQNSTNLQFINDRIYHASLIDNQFIALATTTNGIYIIDFEGNRIQNFTKKEGLQNKNVLNLFVDKQKNIWVGLDNGIDLITYNSSLKLINPLLQDGSAYASIMYNNKLYIGTSNGLYATPTTNENDISKQEANFIKIPNTNGQVWSLSEINNLLLMGHHEGAFTITKNQVAAQSTKTGFWNFTYNNATSQIISGNYKGVSFFETANTNFIELQKTNNFDESSRFLEIDKLGVIWVSHPYRGIYKMEKKNTEQYEVSLFKAENGLPSSLNNHVFKIGAEVVVATTKGIYIYNEQKNKFEVSEFYLKIFGNLSLRYLKEDAENNLWFISEKNIGVVNLKDKNHSLTYFSELNNKLLSGFEFIYPFNGNNIFINGAKGLYHLNFEKYKQNSQELSIQIRNVSISKTFDSVLFGGNILGKDLLMKNAPTISKDWKLIRFQFASPIYGLSNSLRYSYWLKGFDKNWSDWNTKTEKEYTNLPSGEYSFQVKVKNNLGIESTISNYTFVILPAWYKSTLAYLLYFILIGLGIYLLMKWQKKKFDLQQIKYEKEQKKLLYIYELEKAKKESEIVTLKNEKLELDINFQNTELATAAMHLVKKGELLTKIKAELEQATKSAENSKTIIELKKLTKALNEDEKMDKDWEHFAKHFDKVHSDFLTKLKELHSNITPNELKLSAYLRMNLSTKEIAQLMGISPRGVEINRYRLRKKLSLTSEVSLFDYLIKIHF